MTFFLRQIIQQRPILVDFTWDNCTNKINFYDHNTKRYAYFHYYVMK